MEPDNISTSADSPTVSLRVFLSVIGSIIAATGGLTVYSTSDRYYAKDAVRDFKPVYTEIINLKEQIQDLKQEDRDIREWIGHIDRTHPPPELIKDIDDHESRIRALERKR
jgi:hypothetical protein